MKRAALLLALAASGCAVSPRVDYHALSDTPHLDTAVPYALTDSIIVIGAHGAAATPGQTGPADARGAAPVDLAAGQSVCAVTGCSPALAAVAVPVDYTGEYLAIVPRSRHLVSTSIAPTYIPNSLRLRSLAIEVKDHRLEAINAIGAVASGVVSLAAQARKNEDDGDTPPAPPPATLNLPLAIDLGEVKAAAQNAVALPGNRGWSYTAQFLDDPEKAGFQRLKARTGIHAALLTSVCRQLSIVLLHKNGKLAPTRVVLVVTVADPDFIETIPLPAKGAVTPHPLCGADVQAQPVTEIGADEFAAAFFKQVAAIRAARQ